MTQDKTLAVTALETLALEALNEAIKDGDEFPDACHRVANQYCVDQAQLEQAYDAQFHPLAKSNHAAT